MIWVVDASIAVRWLLKNEKHANADRILKRIVNHPESFAVPELFSFEVHAVLSRLHPNGKDAFVSGILPILNGGIHRSPMTETLAETASIYLEKGLTGYDACYAALAKLMNGVWLTFDKKAHKKLSGLNVSHEVSRSLPADFP